jgi:hypothetical protein
MADARSHLLGNMLRSACLAGNAAAVGRLLPEGGTELDLSGPAFQLPDDETKITLLMLAAAGGHTDVVRMILERAPNTTVDSVDVRGFTALFVAAMFHHAEIVRLLAGRGANVNFASLGFTTPLTEATKPQSPVQLADDPDGVRQRKAVRGRCSGSARVRSSPPLAPLHPSHAQPFRTQLFATKILWES